MGGASLWIQECLTRSLTGLSLGVATAYSMLELTKGFRLDQNLSRAQVLFHLSEIVSQTMLLAWICEKYLRPS